MCCKSQLSRRHTYQARESNPGHAFHVLSGEGQAWDQGEKQCRRFLELVKQLLPVLEQLQVAGPQSPRKGMEEGTPQESAGCGVPRKPSTPMISQPWDIPAALSPWLGRDLGSLGLRNEDRDSTSGSVSALSSPGVGRASPKCWARGAGPTAGFGARSQGHSSVGPFLVETSGFWPLRSWVQRWDGDAQLVGCLEATKSLAIGGGSPSGLKGDVLYVGGWGRRGKTFGRILVSSR